MQRGDTLLIKGASGSGKTTALCFAIASRADFDGELLYDGREAGRIRDSERSAFLREQIAVVFQDLKLIPGLTARENIELKRLIAPRKDSAEVEVMAERLGLLRVLDRPVAELSRGEQQRIAVLRALVQPFGFLFLDEPFSHLDPAAAREASALIEQERAARQAAVVLFDLEDSGAVAAGRRIDL